MPIFLFRGEPFWGHDRMPLLEERLTAAGLAPLNPARVTPRERSDGNVRARRSALLSRVFRVMPSLRRGLLASFAHGRPCTRTAVGRGRRRSRAVAQAATDDGGAVTDRSAAGSDEYPTPGDVHRWEVPGSEILRSERRQHDDEADADVDADREEAAQLRRQAADLQESLDRAETQRTRGANVGEDPETARHHAEDVQDQISDLKRRARALDDEASMLAEPPPSDDTGSAVGDPRSAPHVEKKSAAAARRAQERRRAEDPLSDDIDDDLGDDLDGGMD